MASADLVFTQHAEDMIIERAIDHAWVQATIDAPDVIEPDLKRPGVLLAFRKVPERGDRILRVAHVRTGERVRVLTVFFDRARRRNNKSGEA
jgi:hypothetical protein